MGLISVLLIYLSFFEESPPHIKFNMTVSVGFFVYAAGGRARGVGRATKWYGFLPPPSHYFFQLFFGGVDGIEEEKGTAESGGGRERERVKRLTRMGTDRFFWGGGGNGCGCCWLCGGVVVVAGG